MVYDSDKLKLQYQIVGKYNNLKGNPITVSTGRYITTTAVRTFPDNTFLITWSEIDNSYTEYEIHSQTYQYHISLGNASNYIDDIANNPRANINYSMGPHSEFFQGSFAIEAYNNGVIQALVHNVHTLKIRKLNKNNFGTDQFHGNVIQNVCIGAPMHIKLKIIDQHISPFFVLVHGSPANQIINIECRNLNNGQILKSHSIAANFSHIDLDLIYNKEQTNFAVTWQDMYQEKCSGITNTYI